MPKNDTTLVKLNRTDFIPWIQIGTETNATGDPIYARIARSEIFELAFNEVETEHNYICYRDATTDIDGNNVELPEELAMYEGDPAYDFMISHFLSLPTGTSCLVPGLITFGGTDKKAWKYDFLITSKVINPVDGKITFSIKQGGEVTHGTYVITSGQPVFTPDSANEKKDKVVVETKQADKPKGK